MQPTDIASTDAPASDTLRLYYYTTKAVGLKILWERRLKIARYHELNDPFELLPFDRTSAPARRAWEQALERVRQGSHGVICFSESWRELQMWAQYADRHGGLCLGFDVLREYARPMVYLDRPLAPVRLPVHRRGSDDVALVESALRHKPDAWRHEREWRVRARLRTSVDGIYYQPFDRGIELREVILGTRSTLRPDELVHAVENPPMDVEIFATQVRRGSFEIVRHELVETHSVPGFRAALAGEPDAYWEPGEGERG